MPTGKRIVADIPSANIGEYNHNWMSPPRKAGRMLVQFVGAVTESSSVSVDTDAHRLLMIGDK